MLRISIALILVFSHHILNGQTSFYNATQQIMGNERINSTIGIAVDDINGDFKDDLILLDEGKFIKTFIQTASNTPFIYKEHTQTSAFGEWAIITGDLTNDGSPEIIASGNENGSEILFSNNGTYLTNQATPAVYSQNTNLIDFNNDGFLDLFVCNDVGENQTYLNDGDGKMTKVTMIDFKTSEEDDMSGNYSSIFTDIDNDGDLDLYLGKCRASASEPTDPRRINTLYINNGDGTYTERAQEYGLANGSQSWSVDAGDIDNDGDIDLIIANHDREHDLMINDGNGHFDRFGGLPEESKSFAYQSFFSDFDNNGWLDIFITEPSKSYILYNNEMIFSQYDIIQNGKRAFSGATGDFNSDGFADLYLGFADSFQSPGSRTDAVLLNDGNTNNYIQVNLVGTESNYDAIGARIIVHLDNQIRIREVTAGKSYGIMNSTIAQIGLGTEEFIDSIVVMWPSGNVSTITEDINVNSHITISEDECVSPRLELPDYYLCDGNEISIELEQAYNSYLWSDGSTDSVFNVNSPGIYFVTLEKDGCRSVSNYFNVNLESEIKSDEIVFAESLTGCNEQILSLTSISALSYNWSTSDNSRSIEIAESGTYQVTVMTNCDSYTSDPIEIDYYYHGEPEIEEDTFMIGEQATLSLAGNNVNWYRNERDEYILASGNSYVTIPLFRDSTFYAGQTVSDQGITENLMSPVPLNSVSDDQYDKNDTLEFTVLAPIELTSVSVRTQIAGRRVIEIWQDRNIIKSISQEMTTGVNPINLNLKLKSGKYRMTTNQFFNIELLGVPTPKFSYSDQFIGNDKIVESYLKIGGSTVYSGQTPYFFDWNVRYDFYDCEARYPITARLKDDVSTIDFDSEFIIYPNPSRGDFTVESELDLPFYAELWSVDGRLLYRKPRTDSHNQVSVSGLKAGIYFLKIFYNANSITYKVVVEEQ